MVVRLEASSETRGDFLYEQDVEVERYRERGGLPRLSDTQGQRFVSSAAKVLRLVFGLEEFYRSPLVRQKRQF